MICSVCGESFEGRVDAKYCSDKCRMRLKRTESVEIKPNKEIVLDIPVRDNLVRDKVIDIDVPCKTQSLKLPEGHVDLVKDLKLDLKRDLGISSWTDKG